MINQDGIIKARGLVERNGEIILDGGDNGTVKVSGELSTSTNSSLYSSTSNTTGTTNSSLSNASGTTGSTNFSLSSNTGGNITVTGKTIALTDSANLDANGTSGGDKQTTAQVTLNQGSTIQTNATDNGTAGKVTVFANRAS